MQSAGNAPWCERCERWHWPWEAHTPFGAGVVPGGDKWLRLDDLVIDPDLWPDPDAVREWIRNEYDPKVMPPLMSDQLPDGRMSLRAWNEKDYRAEVEAGLRSREWIDSQGGRIPSLQEAVFGAATTPGTNSRSVGQRRRDSLTAA